MKTKDVLKSPMADGILANIANADGTKSLALDFPSMKMIHTLVIPQGMKIDQVLAKVGEEIAYEQPIATLVAVTH